jgi:hypothetical protein
MGVGSWELGVWSWELGVVSLSHSLSHSNSVQWLIKSTFSLSFRGTRNHIKMLDSMTNETLNEIIQYQWSVFRLTYSISTFVVH